MSDAEQKNNNNGETARNEQPAQVTIGLAHSRGNILLRDGSVLKLAHPIPGKLSSWE